MTVFWMLACGASGDVLVPAPPPAPPEELTQSEPEVVKTEGNMSDVHLPTRSFLLASPEQRYACVLPTDGVVELDGRVASLADLPPSGPAAVEGRVTNRDVLVVRHIRVGMAAPTEAAPLPADAAAPAAAETPAPAVVPAPAEPGAQ
jgi:hypothetical protein